MSTPETPYRTPAPWQCARCGVNYADNAWKELGTWPHDPLCKDPQTYALCGGCGESFRRWMQRLMEHAPRPESLESTIEALRQRRIALRMRHAPGSGLEPLVERIAISLELTSLENEYRERVR